MINCKSADTVPTNQPDDAPDARSAPNLAPRNVCDDNTGTNQPTSPSPPVTRAFMQITTQGVAQQGLVTTVRGLVSVVWWIRAA